MGDIFFFGGGGGGGGGGLLLKFKYFLGCLKFLNFFLGGGGGVKGRCWARAYV